MFNDLIWFDSKFLPPQHKKISQSLHEALSEVVSQRPDSPAVIFDAKIYTFRDLVSRVAGLSEEINEIGYHKGPVALLQKVGLDAIAAWFACSNSARPFLLLEPDNPPSRIIEFIKASGCDLAIVDESTSQIFKDLPEVTQLISDGRYGSLKQEKGLHINDPAIIFPTSGSTGNPKLITYTTTTIQVKVQSSIQLMSIPDGARVLIAGSHSNYGFLHHALVFLLSGNTVCLSDLKDFGFDVILDAIIEQNVRHIRFTPSLFRKFAVLPKAQEALFLLHAVRFSGEPLLESDLKLARSVLNPNCLIQNIYGSTESSLFIWNSFDYDPNDLIPAVPIGNIYPLSSYAIRPLDDFEKNTGKGELLIRSKFHAIGDFNAGLIDKKRFPLSKGSTSERIYSTGDIVRQLANGSLIHLGRIGRMVKIRGYRVYLTEIEQQLCSIPGVIGAAVVDRVEQNSPVIYGFIATKFLEITADDVRRKLSSLLPDYMIPKRIEILPQIPTMAGGKVDYQALASLISIPYSSRNLSTHKTNSESLIQIWDSLLWEGAHKHNSDFFSLGGDSIGFFLLLEKIKQYFEKNLSPEELRAKCTLKNLAAILGLETNYKQVIKYKSMQVSLSWPSVGCSRGVALAMPGYGGSSSVYPFYQAEFFNDYDIWVIEFPIEKGSLLNANRWWIAALEIVQGIKEGVVPTPHVIFGFSFGGGLGWLVGRLLATSSFAPKFVVMVDAAPLHRRWRFSHRQIKNLLENTSNIKFPKVFHLRRSAFGNGGILNGRNQDWSEHDNICYLVDLPTVDHMEMINWKSLRSAQEALRDFLNSEETSFKWVSVKSETDLLGFHIFRAFNASQTSLQKVKVELTKDIEMIKQDCFINIIILMYVINDTNRLEKLIQIAIEKWSESGTVHYINCRLRRDSNLLFSENIPNLFPSNIVSVEYKLTSLMKGMVHQKSRLIRLLFLAFDVCFALFLSRYFRYKKQYYYGRF